MNADRLLNVVIAVAALAAVGLLGVRQFDRKATARTGGSASARQLTPAQQAEVDRLSSPPLRSDSTARLRVVAFADVQCPFCAQLDLALDSMVDAGAPIEYQLLHFPLPQHEFARLGARALECAGEQRRFDELRRAIFRHQGRLQTMPFDSFAVMVDVPDIAAFRECLRADSRDSRIEASIRLGQELGLRGTPLVIVEGFVLDRPPRAAVIAKMHAARLAGASPVEVLGSGGYDAVRSP